MEEQDALRQRVVDAVTTFQKDQMSVSAESVSVDLHFNSLVVTLQGIYLSGRAGLYSGQRSTRAFGKISRGAL